MASATKTAQTPGTQRHCCGLGVGRRPIVGDGGLPKPLQLVEEGRGVTTVWRGVPPPHCNKHANNVCIREVSVGGVWMSGGVIGAVSPGPRWMLLHPERLLRPCKPLGHNLSLGLGLHKALIPLVLEHLQVMKQRLRAPPRWTPR